MAATNKQPPPTQNLHCHSCGWHEVRVTLTLNGWQGNIFDEISFPGLLDYHFLLCSDGLLDQILLCHAVAGLASFIGLFVYLFSQGLPVWAHLKL